EFRTGRKSGREASVTHFQFPDNSAKNLMQPPRPVRNSLEFKSSSSSQIAPNQITGTSSNLEKMCHRMQPVKNTEYWTHVVLPRDLKPRYFLVEKRVWGCDAYAS
ncbi:hypothetical protein PIB30_107889, partial [Stylosanthes scabra]|nr:hypothetical protein [Stylosanthes scabra]